MRIEHEFEYDASYGEIANEFCSHDSKYQAETINWIGYQFKKWEQDKTRTATHIQLLDIAEQLNKKGKWFIRTLYDYMTESQPKTGHWIVVNDGYVGNAYICKCSECEDSIWVYSDADKKWNYCPNCGTKMIEV